MSERELHLGFEGEERREKARLPDGEPVPWDLDSDLTVVGTPRPRRDGRLKVTGAAKFAYDIRFPDMIHARFLVSPYAHARVKRVDLARARAMKGVLYTESYEGSTIRFAGQQVAGVAAGNEQVLADALAAIDVEYEVLPCVTTVGDAMREGAPVVQGDSNVRGGRPGRGLERVKKAHAEADVMLEREYRTQVQTHSCLETHGCVCKWEGDRLTCWSSTQGTFSVQGSLAGALRIPRANVTVITEHMGGGFGSKFGADAWDVFCAKAARATGRPCRFMLDRRAEHLVAGNRPDSVQKCRFSAKRDGTLMGAEVRSWGTAGIAPGGANVFNPGIYAFKARFSEQHTVLTHAGRGRAFRAPGHPQGIFALESMIDELAAELGLDPLELRKKNDPNPVRLAQYRIGAREIGWERRQELAGRTGRFRRGLGMAAARWGHNARPGAVVACRIGKDGSVLFANGAQDLGTGTRTVIGMVGAEELGLEPGDVEVRLGHTSDPVGPASGGSVTTPTISPAVRDAAWEAKRQLLAHVAKAVGGDAEKMDLRGGRVTGAPRELTFRQACGLMPVDTVEALGRGRPGLPRFTREVAGVQFAEVEVDTATGRVRVVKVVAVQDCGLVINPLTARSQINGGVIQGLSYALFEERLLDPRSGNMVNADFLGYKILGALDMPEIVAIPFSVANGITNTGASSLGEPPTTPTAGAVANAVAHALGVRIRSLPITPAKVLAALGGV